MFSLNNQKKKQHPTAKKNKKYCKCQFPPLPSKNNPNSFVQSMPPPLLSFCPVHDGCILKVTQITGESMKVFLLTSMRAGLDPM